MLNVGMSRKPRFRGFLVYLRFVRHEMSALIDVLYQVRYEYLGAPVRYVEGAYLSFSLHHAEYDSLAREGHLLLRFAAYVRLVHLNDAREQPVLLRHHGTYLMAYAECSLIGNTQLSLQLLSGDAVLAYVKEKERMEPQRERGRRTLEDSPFQRIYLAPFAIGIAHAGRDAVVALQIGIAGTEYEVQTASIIWKLIS